MMLSLDYHTRDGLFLISKTFKARTKDKYEHDWLLDTKETIGLVDIRHFVCIIHANCYGATYTPLYRIKEE